jgi:predicted AAA+ superfamily ATPase
MALLKQLLCFVHKKVLILMQDESLHPSLQRIADALERIAPPLPSGHSDLREADAFVWHPPAQFEPVENVHALPLSLIRGIDLQKQILWENSERFTLGHAANNALLWGARGTGKSSLVKAVHRELAQKYPGRIALLEIAREDIGSLPQLIQRLNGQPRRFLLLCDDLSFDSEDSTYKSLKSVLEGGLRGRPENVLFYATSNRRHLIPREMMENEQRAALHGGEVIDEKVSLSDRFGLWLGFHHMEQATYLAIIESYLKHFALVYPPAQWQAEAIEWSRTRGSCSGRVAWQYITDLAGRLGKPLRF